MKEDLDDPLILLDSVTRGYAKQAMADLAKSTLRIAEQRDQIANGIHDGRYRATRMPDGRWIIDCDPDVLVRAAFQRGIAGCLRMIASAYI